ncbi:MarR family winged helix-turn-helix transcriptional regulator [Moraxella oblonga]|uniref:MarR family winged helix-turn-helix transcriptional regulator n=1 Tax=Moraxella oblonga TaxID=200413 RepID=UPI00082969EF|nr:MarR family transcriptional regulator [Moraxella oblonga]
MHEQLKLSNQLCFPLYVLSKAIIKKYTPFLDTLDLTYPQYLVMLILWEFGEQSVGDIGDKLYLDSGTLTPLLKRLQNKGLVERKRSTTDERSVVISLTDTGRQLENQATHIPQEIGKCLHLSVDEINVLKKIVERVGE